MSKDESTGPGSYYSNGIYEVEVVNPGARPGGPQNYPPPARM